MSPTQPNSNGNQNGSSQGSNGSAPPVKMYVGNIPASARNSELKELFEKFGKVAECDILKDYGFVHMSDSNDAKAAIAGLNDTLWKGSRIRVELSTTKTSKGKPAPRPNNPKQFGNGGSGYDRYNNHMNMNEGPMNNGFNPRFNNGGGYGGPMHRGGPGARPSPYPRDNFHHPYGSPQMDMGGPAPYRMSRNNGSGGGPMRGILFDYSNKSKKSIRNCSP